MKSSRIIALIILFIGAVIISIPLFVKHIQFEYKIEPYAPISKAYSDLVFNYEDLYLSQNAKNKEESQRAIVTKKENEFLETMVHHNGMKIHTNFEFVDRTKKTRLLIKEEITFDSWLEHAFGVLFSSSVYEQRERHYINLKQSIESSPDSSIIPSELK